MANKVTIYKGSIRRLYADDAVLEQDKVVPIIHQDILTDQALFTHHFHKFTSLDYGVILFSEDEALDYVRQIVEQGEALIHALLADPSVTEEEKKAFFRALKQSTRCVFVNTEEIKVSHTITRDEFKSLKKTRIEQKHF